MTANNFKVRGDPIDSQPEFMRREHDNKWANLLYYPDTFTSETRTPIVLKGKVFSEISFKDTDLKRVRFIRCKFERCLFIGASFSDCEFTDCEFVSTNTSKLRIRECLLDPACFKNNFDLINDTNIAIDLYHAVYRNASEEHQPKHALESLYRMKQAEEAHLNSQRDRGVISKLDYRKKKAAFALYDFVSGYGLKTVRVLRLLLIVIVSFTALNYFLADFIFSSEVKLSPIDAFYFTCITITTLGFGDITPTTQMGKILVTFQALSGFVVISIFLAAVANSAIRAR